MKTPQEIARFILAQHPKRPLKIAIDGKCCAGKTTFADDLGKALKKEGFTGKIIRPSIDGFHNPREIRYQLGNYSAEGYYLYTYDLGKIRKNLLFPLAQGPYPAKCQSVSFDYRENVPAEEFEWVEKDTILIFEGLFLMKPDLNEAWDYRILLDISDENSLERALKRDLELFGSAEEVRKRYLSRYIPAWHIYEERVNPAQFVDTIIGVP